MRLTLTLAILFGGAVWAADPTPLDLKTGQWEYNVTTQMAGMPQQNARQMPQIPPEQLAKLPPEQRAKMEEAMKKAGAMASGQPTTTTTKTCLKKEDLAKFNPRGDSDKTCKITMLSSSRSKQELKMDCDSNGTKSTSTMTVEAMNSENIKFNLQVASDMNGKPMNMTINGAGKWLSSTCTDSK